MQREREGADRHDSKGEHDPAHVLPDAMTPYTLLPHTTILSLVILSKSLDCRASPSTPACTAEPRCAAHFLWSQGLCCASSDSLSSSFRCLPPGRPSCTRS